MVVCSPKPQPHAPPGSRRGPLFVGSFDYELILRRDAFCKNFFWTVLAGKPTTSAKLRPNMVTRGRTPPPDEYADSKGIRPQRRVIHWPKAMPMHRPPLDARLQAYFYKMQRAASRTCHPSVISQEARLIIHSLTMGGEPRLKEVAQGLFNAGVSQIEHSRTVALLIHDVLIELQWSEYGGMAELRSHLEMFATTALSTSWLSLQSDFSFLPTKTGLEATTDSLDPTRNEMMNTAAFFGDLVAIGAIPVTTFSSRVADFIEVLSSVSQCRALYLLLLRATLHVGAPIHLEHLMTWRKRLSDPARSNLLRTGDMARRWIMEICHVIDCAARNTTFYLRGEEAAPLGAHHTWDKKLTKQSLHDLLQQARRHDTLPPFA